MTGVSLVCQPLGTVHCIDRMITQGLLSSSPLPPFQEGLCLRQRMPDSGCESLIMREPTPPGQDFAVLFFDAEGL